MTTPRTDSAFAFEVRGVKEVQEALELARKDLCRGFATGLAYGALLVANQAKKKAPHEFGNLIRSIHVGRADAAWNVFANVTEKQGEEGAATPIVQGTLAGIADELDKNDLTHVTAGTDVEYAEPQEYLWERCGQIGRAHV
jgi:hypothetical protein